MVPVETEFIHNEKKYHQANGDPDRQPKDVDKGKYLTFHQVSPGYYQVIFKHNNLFSQKNTTIPAF